ncbi:hypothetical protein FACS1894219_09290 [Clostridia bacterium]|nr:hypothetical protein FACS1894219_09290 [Clostridia bacterium]
MKKTIILVIIILFNFMVSCEEKDNESIGNTQFISHIYENSPALNLKLHDEVQNIIRSENSGNYYISFFNSEEYMERIEVYSENFEFIKTISSDIAKLDQNLVRFFVFDIDKNNNIYLLQNNKNDDDVITAHDRLLLVFDNDGKILEKIKIDDAADIWDGHILSKLFVTENNFIFVSSVGVQITDKKGKTIKEITDDEKSPYFILSADTDNDGSLYISCGDGILKKINISDGKEIWSIKESKGYPINRVSYSKEDNQICVYKSEVLSLYDINGNFLGDICDLRDFKPTSDSSNFENYNSGMLNALLYKNSATIIFSFTLYKENSKVSELVRLQALSDEETNNILKEREEQQNSKKSIKIFTPYYDIDLERIIHEFNSINPDIYAEMEYYTEDLMLFNSADYTQYVSMRINSGDADWDIISGNFIPYDIYKSKGYFTDIDVLDTDNIFKDTEKYYTNIIDALRNKDGGFYLFPELIMFDVVESLQTPTESDILSLRSMIEENKPVFYDKSLYSSIFANLFSEFVSTEYRNIMFDKIKFYEVLDIVDKFSDDSLYTSEKANAKLNLFTLAFINADVYEPKESLNILPSNINTTDDVKYLFQAQGYLIWAKSEVQNEALDFLMYMSDNNGSFGISRIVLNKQLAEYKEGIYNKIKMYNSSALDEYNAKTDRFVQDVERIYEKLNYTSAYNYELIKLLHGELEKYREGSITKESFAEKIEDFLWLLENEDK